jgi:hypothetical protein
MHHLGIRTWATQLQFVYSQQEGTCEIETTGASLQNNDVSQVINDLPLILCRLHFFYAPCPAIQTH